MSDFPIKNGYTPKGWCIISRQARRIAESGIYHIMLRGIDRRRIFEDTQDYLFFLEILEECRLRCGFRLYAYCLMDNHVHILLRVGEEKLESTMKRLACRYVYWFNAKYQRTGHLFQDRFRSESVDTDTYFLTVLRYIHQNPVKAKLCAAPGDYLYSSYAHYLGSSQLVDTDFAMGMMTRDEFVRFNCEKNDDQCLELTRSRCAMSDDQAQKVIEKISRCASTSQFQMLDQKKQAHYIKRIHEKGASIRQISRLTGISKGMVERWIKA